MTKSKLTSLLLSLFVLPGLGHIFSDSFLIILWEGMKKTWDATQTICLLGLEAFGIIWLATALDLLRR